MTVTRSRLARFVLDNSLLLLAGTGAAVVWANLDFRSYDRVAHPLNFVENDIGMVFFFALAAKEVFEATLPGGSLASPRRALSPLAAAVGGMAAPALIYAGLVPRLGDPVRDGHRVLGDGRARDLSGRAPGHPVSAAPRDRRRRTRIDHPRGLLPIGP